MFQCTSIYVCSVKRIHTNSYSYLDDATAGRYKRADQAIFSRSYRCFERNDIPLVFSIAINIKVPSMNDRFVLSWERHAVMLLLAESDQPFQMKFPKRIESRFSIVGLVIEPHSYVIYPEFICFVTLPTIWLSCFRFFNVLLRLLIVLAESDIANRRYIPAARTCFKSAWFRWISLSVTSKFKR